MLISSVLRLCSQKNNKKIRVKKVRGMTDHNYVNTNNNGDDKRIERPHRRIGDAVQARHGRG